MPSLHPTAKIFISHFIHLFKITYSLQKLLLKVKHNNLIPYIKSEKFSPVLFPDIQGQKNKIPRMCYRARCALCTMRNKRCKFCTSLRIRIFLQNAFRLPCKVFRKRKKVEFTKCRNQIIPTRIRIHIRCVTLQSSIPQ